ncbi:GATA-binding protein [Spraguea lophii 42_110]|uniref:GATA-binding protein n=1 Tax=Spraguea lophii (strain 42_110) TaxID=1358809 RepID=S7WB06_SPRLO|nr:GATA-binding protein [Spraguea lophii 42_110]
MKRLLYDIDVYQIFNKVRSALDDGEKTRASNYTWRLWTMYILNPKANRDKLTFLRDYYIMNELTQPFEQIWTVNSAKTYPKEEGGKDRKNGIEIDHHNRCYQPLYTSNMTYNEELYNIHYPYNNYPYENKTLDDFYINPEYMDFENIYDHQKENIMNIDMTSKPKFQKPVKMPNNSSKKNKRGRKKLEEIYGKENIFCVHCGTKKTTLWRRWYNESFVCNACGLYFKLHNKPRPLKLQEKHIKRRDRGKIEKTKTNDEKHIFY